MEISRLIVEEILRERAFEKFVGEFESHELECKQQPYDFSSDRGKRELCKDVIAFANSIGGCILIGLKTEKDPNHLGDVVTELNLISPQLINPGTYRDFIAKGVYPEVIGLRCEWLAQIPGETSSRGIFQIDIPPQPDGQKPYLIRKTVDEDGKISETVFGYCQRRGSANPPLKVEELHKFLALGMSYDRQIEKRFNSLEALLAAQSNEPPQAIARRPVFPSQTKLAIHDLHIEREPEEGMSLRIVKALNASGLEGKRALILTASSAPALSLKSIFQTSPGSLMTIVENPPSLRASGWDTQTLGQAQIVRGELLRVVQEGIKGLDLYRDGAMILTASAEEHYLGWDPSTLKVLNATALVESVVTFVMLYESVLNDALTKPRVVSLTISLRQMKKDGIATVLKPFYPSNPLYQSGLGKKKAPEGTWSTEKQFDANDLEAGRASFQLVQEVYLWFGFDETKIPYVRRESKGPLIDIAALRNTQ